MKPVGSREGRSPIPHPDLFPCCDTHGAEAFMTNDEKKEGSSSDAGHAMVASETGVSHML